MSRPRPSHRRRQASQPGHDDSWIYWTVGAVVVVLAVIGLITYSGEKDDRGGAAEGRSSSRSSSSRPGCPCQRSGHHHPVRSAPTAEPSVRTPPTRWARRSCNDQLTNGADFVGRRPVIIDRRIVLGEALILQTYCPDKLKEYQDKIDDLKYDNTIKE